jgi:hypothetical protein
MWAYLVGIVVIMVGLFGTFAGAGIFTIALIPIGAIIFVGGIVYALLGRSAQEPAAGGSSSRDAQPPLPHSPSRPSGHAPTTPEALADARRAEQ